MTELFRPPQALDPKQDKSYEALQRSLRSSAAIVEGAAQSARRPERPGLRHRPGAWLRSHLFGTGFALRHRPGAWLRSHMFGVAFVLLTLVAVVESIYILKPGWFRAIGAATVVAEAPPAAAPKAVPIVRGEPRAKEPSAGVGATGVVEPGGRLSIRSEPSGAQVSIDGRFYGVTPLTLAAVTPGDRRIVLKLNGREVRQSVRVEPGGTASVIAPMGQTNTSTSGWIAIVSAAELDIEENGVLVGSTRSAQIMMPPGLHTLRLLNQALGYRGTQQIRVAPGKVARVSITLPESAIHLNAQPWAEVWIDGKSFGETPIGNLPLRIGTHVIVFRHPELGEKTVSTVVKAGAPTRVTVDLRK